MPKNRKTRKHKILTEQKKKVVQEITPSMELLQRDTAQSSRQQAVTQGMTFSLPTNYNNSNTKKDVPSSIKITTISTADYDYLGKDLIRTTLISCAIVLAELLIRLFYIH